MILPWTVTRRAAQQASADALWAVQASTTAMETSEATLKLCKRVLVLDALACLLLLLVLYAYIRRA